MGGAYAASPRLLCPCELRLQAHRWRPFLSDPDDDFVLELAVSAGARYIVTHNMRNFTGADSLGVTALRPAEFLKLLNTTKP